MRPVGLTTAPGAPETNHHCSVVVVEGQGVLIEGASGSGKTSVALGLVDTARARGLASALVCDDQALIVRDDAGRLNARAPAATAGLAELRGYGVTRVAHAAGCRVALVARLVEAVERSPEPATTRLGGVDLPLILLPARHEQQSVRILLAWLADHAPDGGTARP